MSPKQSWTDSRQQIEMPSVVPNPAPRITGIAAANSLRQPRRHQTLAAGDDALKPAPMLVPGAIFRVNAEFEFK
jgi:hypothetical protein